MFPRIPHVELEIITGKQTAEDYLAMQEKLGKFYLKKFLQILGAQKKTGAYLEIGCGPGYQTAQVAEQHSDSRIQALEPSADMIAVARDYAQKQGLGGRIKFVQGSGKDDVLIALLGKFDLIYSTFSLHHWNDPAKALKNLYRALKKDGIIVIHDFERHWSTYYLPFLRKGIIESIKASYTIKEMTSMMTGLYLKNFQAQRHFPYLSVALKK